MMERNDYIRLWRALQDLRVQIYNNLLTMTDEQRATLATDLEQALARLRGGETADEEQAEPHARRQMKPINPRVN